MNARSRQELADCWPEELIALHAHRRDKSGPGGFLPAKTTSHCAAIWRLALSRAVRWHLGWRFSATGARPSFLIETLLIARSGSSSAKTDHEMLP
jgi:hypothetical protein